MNPFLKIIGFSFLVLSLYSCQSSSTVSQADEPISYLALGDSYTIGEGVKSTENWPNQLVNVLKEEDIEIENLKIVAQTGWTTRDLLNAIEAEEITGKYDLVTLLIGVNNQYQGLDFEEFKVEFLECLDKAVSFSGTEKVIVVSIPDYGVSPFGKSKKEKIKQELNFYNSYMKKKTEERDFAFVNITEISRSLGSGEKALAPDNLHPSGFQYGLWVKEILPIVREEFN